MSLSGLLTKHKKEGFTAIPVAEQIEMCRNAMGDGGVNLTKLNELVAKHFNVRDDPQNYGHFDCNVTLIFLSEMRKPMSEIILMPCLLS